MATTSKPNDKYAFLFTGPTEKTFLVDLKNVFDLLTKYYNYPPGHITIVCGSTPTPPVTMPSFPSVTVKTITSLAMFNNELAAFAAAAAGAPKTALLYFTGGGVLAGGTSKLVISGAATLDPAGLAAKLAAFGGCQINVVMQQSYGGGFLSAFSALTSQWSFTRAASATETTYGDDVEGGFFTAEWIKGLKFNLLPPGAPNAGQYADTLGSATDYLISMQKAEEFARQAYDVDYGLSTPAYNGTPGIQTYLGLPEFLLHDGSPSWWESADIFLTHPNAPSIPANDLYIPDVAGAAAPYNNTINVVTYNAGTHPVRRYSLGIELFKSGAGVTNDKKTVTDHAPAAGVLLPNASDTVQWNTPFYWGTTHECVKAEAKRLASDVDFTWNIVGNNFEAQRNTDPMPLAPPPPPQPAVRLAAAAALPAVPKAAPAAFGAWKEHEYGLHNRFGTARQFRVIFPPQIQKYAKNLELAWFEKSDEHRSEATRLAVIETPRPHLLIPLDAGASRTLILRARILKSLPGKKEVRLAFAIAADVPETRVPAAKTRPREDGFTEVAGFTVVIREAAATIRGTIVDRNGKPAAHAKVLIEAVNGRQGIVVETDAKGRYELANMHPDVYKIKTELEGWRSDEKMLVLGEKGEEKLDLHLKEKALAREVRVKVVLDRLRILDDSDPLLAAKGDVVLDTVVVPDFDEAAKQVTRLPIKDLVKSDQPLGITVFEGPVKEGALDITVGGAETERYHRMFSGTPEKWVGDYRPGDEYLQRKVVGEWALWYHIERA